MTPDDLRVLESSFAGELWPEQRAMIRVLLSLNPPQSDSDDADDGGVAAAADPGVPETKHDDLESYASDDADGDDHALPVTAAARFELRPAARGAGARLAGFAPRADGSSRSACYPCLRVGDVLVEIDGTIQIGAPPPTILDELRRPPPLTLRFLRTDEPLPGAPPPTRRRSSVRRLAERLNLVKV